jgi:hypothetical protein
MKNWSLAINLIDKHFFLLGFLYREGTYKPSQESTEIREYSELCLGIGIISIELKLYY